MSDSLLSTRGRSSGIGGARRLGYLGLSILAAVGSSVAAADVPEMPSGMEVAARIDARPRPDHSARTGRLVLVDSRGRQRERVIRSFRKEKADAHWIALFAIAPPSFRHRAFLAYDYSDADRDDDQWHYLPERKRAQRLAAKRRGDAFLGSGFSFEDMKKEGRIEVEEFDWRTLRADRVGEHEVWVVEQVPATKALAKDLGYTRALTWVDATHWIPRRMEFFTDGERPFKTFEMRAFEEIDGVWMLRRILALDHRTKDRSILVYPEIDIESSLPDEIFRTQTLEAERARETGLPTD
jgi:hypothetical protein